MSAPFHLPFPSDSPQVPRPPHATPSEYPASRLRPPIHNPFDKFTQPEFDSWIGDITGALKRALGQVDLDADSQFDRARQSPFGHDPTDDEDDHDILPEDSFAEHLARKRDKGKARDPREGPGLIGQGDKDQPFELLSDDDDQEASPALNSYSNEEGYEEHKNVDDDDEGDDDDDDEDEGEYEDEENRQDEMNQQDSDEEAYSDDIFENLNKQPHEEDDDDEVIEIVDSDEAESPVAAKKQSVEYHEDDEEEYSVDEGEEEYSNEDENDELAQEEDEMQPLDDDTSFPPRHSVKRKTAIRIPDPWKEVETYAEDFYSGGDRAVQLARRQQQSHITADSLEDAYDGFFTPDMEGNDADLQEEKDGEHVEDESSVPGSNLVLSPNDTLQKLESTPRRGAAEDETLNLDQLYDDVSASIVQTDNSQREAEEVVSELVDWNNPATFPEGIPAISPGRLDRIGSGQRSGSIEPIIISSEGEIQAENEEEDEEDYLQLHQTAGAFPLGTSDLDYENEEVGYGSSPPAAYNYISDQSDDEEEDSHDGVGEITMASEVIEPEGEEGLVRGTSRETEPEEIVLAQGEGVTEAEDSIDPSVEVVDIARSEVPSSAAMEEMEHTTQAQEGQNAVSSVEVPSVHNVQVAAPTAEQAAGPSAVVSAQPYVPVSVPISLPLSSFPFLTYPGIDQLPTPPSEPITPPPDTKVHREVEEIPDEDAVTHIEISPLLYDDGSHGRLRETEKVSSENAGTNTDEQDSANKATSEFEARESAADEDADGEADIDVEIISVASSSSNVMHVDMSNEGEQSYIVEEPTTDGRPTLKSSKLDSSVLKFTKDALHESIFDDNSEISIPKVTESEISSSELLGVPQRAPAGQMPGSPMDGSNITFFIHEPSPMLMDDASDFGETEQVEAEERQNISNLTEPEREALTKAPEMVEQQEAHSTGDPSTASNDALPTNAGTTAIEGNFPMPVSADANVPDPVESPARQRNPSLIISLPGTPTFMLSPVGTPGIGTPVPVSIPVPQSILQALKRHNATQSQVEVGSSGLFTPADASRGTTPDIQIQQDASTSERQIVHVPKEPERPISFSEETQAGNSMVSSGDAELPKPDTSAFVSAAHDLVASNMPRPVELPQSVHTMEVVLTRGLAQPVLVADPYPISLSTPGVNNHAHGPTYDRKRLEYSSPALADDATKKQEVKKNDADDGVAPNNPSSPQENIAMASSGNTHTGADTDADGELDPELIGAVDGSPRKSKRHSPIPASILKETDPFKLMGTDSNVAPGPVEEQSSISEGNSVDTTPMTEKREPSLPIEPNADSNPAVLNQAEGESRLEDVITVEPQDKNTQQGEPDRKESHTSGENDKAQAWSKRKRSPLEVKTSNSGDEAASSPVQGSGNSSGRKSSKSRTSKRKLKPSAKNVVGGTIHVKPRPVDTKTEYNRASSEKPSEVSVGSSTSSAKAAAKLLQPGSRASSVASDWSLALHPSPTTQKSATFVPPPPPPIPSLFHAHGQARSMYANSNLTVQQQIRQFQRAPSLTRIGEHRPRASLPSPTASSPTIKSPVSLSQRSQPSANSPVTRSHCKYHRISLPKEEGGPRVCFMVPGCSLNDRELMAVEEIEDHGDAKQADIDNAVGDIDTLDFDEVLFATLRQLVGPDIMHRQEVYYLPSPGEEVQRKPRKAERANSIQAHGSPYLSMYARSPGSWKTTGSAGGSTASISRLKKARGSEKDSMSVTDTETDIFSEEDNDRPKAKRARPTPPDEKADSGVMGPPSQSVTANRLKSRKSKRLSVDALAYKPETEESGHSSGEEGSHGPRKKPKSKKRGIKRSHTYETAHSDNAERAMKKLKLHATVSTIPQGRTTADGSSRTIPQFHTPSGAVSSAPVSPQTTNSSAQDTSTPVGVPTKDSEK